jgi:hypothetical protein
MTRKFGSIGGRSYTSSGPHVKVFVEVDELELDVNVKIFYFSSPADGETNYARNKF